MRCRPTRVARLPGLSLLELLVVLVILTILAGVVITSTAGLTSQARFDQTRQSLDALRDAVLGGEAPRGAPAGSAAPGFVADLGRLPFAIDEAGVLTLRELFAPGALPAFAAQSIPGDDTAFTDDLELTLLCGWRGPYARLPIGVDLPEDGWGRPFLLDDADGDPVIDTTTAIARIAFDDANPALPSPYDQPLDVVFQDAPADVDRVAAAANLQADVDVDEAAGETVILRLYGPVDGVPATLRQYPDPDVAGDPAAAPGDGVAIFSADDLTLGPKLLVAYVGQWTALPQADETIDTNLVDRDGGGLDADDLRRVTLPLVLPAGGETFTMEVR